MIQLVLEYKAIAEGHDMANERSKGREDKTEKKKKKRKDEANK